MHDFFDSLENQLYNKVCDFDRSLHSSGHSDTVIDNFVHELKNYLFVSDAKHQLSKISKDSVLEINEIENDYVQCYLDHKDYLVPKEMINVSELNAEDVGFIRTTIAK